MHDPGGNRDGVSTVIPRTSPQVGRSDMRRHATVLGFGLAGIAGFAAFVAWAFYATSKMGNGWRDLAPVWPYVLGGVVATALLSGVLMWLAFYSDNHGYDDGVDLQDGPH